MELACRVGTIPRTLIWHRALQAFDPGDVSDEWADAPFETLTSLLEDSYLGQG